MKRAFAAIAASGCALLMFASSGAAESLAPGDDATRPHVVRALPTWQSIDVAPIAAGYAGIWQNAPSGSEPGWAITLAPRGGGVLATWLTYDADGSPVWLALAADDVSDMLADRPPHTVFAGELYRAYAAADGSVAAVAYGPAAIEFAAPDAADFHYNVDGVWRRKAVERAYVTGPLATCSAAPQLSGVWIDGASRASERFAPAVHVARADDALIVTWSTYDARGNAVWRVMAATRTGANEFSGVVHRARGPALDTPFDPLQVTVSAGGSGTLTFTDTAQALFTFVVDDTPGAIALTQQRPASPITFCE
jgi:hypothetical protein